MKLSTLNKCISPTTLVRWTILIGLYLSVLTCGQTWKQYPFALVPSNPQFTFPAAEGAHETTESDTWFMTAHLQGKQTGTNYQFVCIFDRNNIDGVKFNFYQVSIFNCDKGEYVTYTEWDLDPFNNKLSYSNSMVNLNFVSDLGQNITWHNAYSPNGTIIPFVYSVSFVGKDDSGSSFAANVVVNTVKEPKAFGLTTLDGIMTFWGQAGTSSYFQTGLETTGTITYQGLTEAVSGTFGHIDRQWFPYYPGIDSPFGREHSHEWRQINLYNGVDIASWRQFDRTKGNLLINTTGTTTNPPANIPAAYVDGVEVEYISYAKWPRDAFPTIDPPPSPNMWLPSSHIVRIPSLQIELKCTYLAPVPAVHMPIEYFEGPATWQGTYNGAAVSGIGIFESTLGLYRDWELVQVLCDSVSHLPTSSFTAGTQKETISTLSAIQQFIFYGETPTNQQQGMEYIRSNFGKVLPNIINSVDSAYITQIVGDLEVAIINNYQ